MAFSKKNILLSLSLSIAIFVFLKNAWVTEDAYIIFRSIEQLFSGNGPVWNPHERVQVFTSPLWYYVLAFGRIFCNDVYLNAIILSFLFWLATLLVLKAIFKKGSSFLCAIILFSGSTAFFDYTSSGLENILAYFLIAVYILNFLGLFIVDDNYLNKPVRPASRIKVVLLVFGLIICTRHDLALLVFPPTIYVVLKNYKNLSIKQWVFFSVIALLPFSLYSLFSLVYYGFPFPNTAYAKLNTGIDTRELLEQGINYFYSSFKYDTITLIVILAALVFSFFRPSQKCFKYLGYGIILNLFYVCYIGGDFMQGRFFSYAYMVAVIVLLLSFTKFHSRELIFVTLIVGCSYLVFYPHTPFNSPFNYINYNQNKEVADERGHYFEELSLLSYYTRDRGDQLFPHHNFAIAGYKFKGAPDKIVARRTVGLFGFHAGIDKIIIDRLALSDPLLARMPITGRWRIGHFQRELPDGYIKSIMHGNETITNPEINEFYSTLKSITQSQKLFTLTRLKTIMFFNLGAYDHLLLEK
jgi:arabinofuranosyltransferase